MSASIGHGINGSPATANAAVTSSVPSSGSGGYLNTQKDLKDSSTAPKFGDVYQQIQAKYGAKAEKPREIKKTLGKDDFLKIMITQMRHQDPTNPFKPEQMAAEMAQFASVEQLQNVNQNLSKMTSQNQPLERLAMTGMIGKVVTIDRDRFPHSEGSSEALSFSLPKDARSVNVAIVSEGGEVVYEQDMGALKAGENSVSWDGLKKGTPLPAKAGTYMLRVTAKDEMENSMQTGTKGMARIIGVSFEGSEPVFLVGDANRQEKVTLRNIIKVETDAGQFGAAPAGGAGAQAAAKPGSAIAAVPATNQPNFFSFQKGVGSSNLDHSALTPEAQAAITNFQAKKAAPASAEAEPKGFPNGLSDNEDGASSAAVSNNDDT